MDHYTAYKLSLKRKKIGYPIKSNYDGSFKQETNKSRYLIKTPKIYKNI